MKASETGPDYYKSAGVEPWDAMQAWMTKEQFIGFLRGNAIKYLARADTKHGGIDALQDYRKAGHYIDKLCEVLGDDDAQ